MTQFVKDDFDKFKEIRRRSTPREIEFLTDPGHEDNIKAQLFWKGKLGLLYFETATKKSLNITMEYLREGRADLDQGALIFHIDGKNHRFTPSEHSATRISPSILETCLYELTPDQLRTLASASRWEVQVSGGRAKNEFIVEEPAIVIFRQFYNQVFDQSAFVESINYVPPRAACFPATARILTPTGYQALEHVEPGTSVLSWSGLALRRQRVVRKLAFPASEVLSLRVEGFGCPIRVTPSHSLLTKDGWRRAGTLASGAILQCVAPGPSMEWARVLGVGVESKMQPVFNLYTTGDHNFVADGIVSHNFTAFRRIRTLFHQMLFDWSPLFDEDRENASIRGL